MSEKKTPPRDYDKAVGHAVEKHLERRCTIFLEEAVAQMFETLGPEKTKKILEDYIQLVKEFH